MIAPELFLLIWCEFHHAELLVMVECGKDSILDAEVRMTHVRALDGSS